VGVRGLLTSPAYMMPKGIVTAKPALAYTLIGLMGGRQRYLENSKRVSGSPAPDGNWVGPSSSSYR
jgi:hypothetical protein